MSSSVITTTATIVGMLDLRRRALDRGSLAWLTEDVGVEVGATVGAGGVAVREGTVAEAALGGDVAAITGAGAAATGGVVGVVG